MVERSAEFSPCGYYRYWLARMWSPERPCVMFVGLNPSTADDKRDDPTVRRFIHYARDWGYGGVLVLNLFAFRATDPSDLFRAADPIGPENDAALARGQSIAALVVAAWGNHGTHLARAAEVLPALRNPHYLRINRTGQPAHPLYLPKCLKPRPLETSPSLKTSCV